MDFSDYPTSSRPVPWKLILIIVGGIVIALSVIAGVYMATRPVAVSVPTEVGGSVFTSTQNSTTPSVFAEGGESCLSDQGVDVCKIQQKKALALTERRVEACDIEDAWQKDDCVWGVSVLAQNESWCEGIQNVEIRMQCADDVFAQKAIRVGDAGGCDKIQSAERKTACAAFVQTFAGRSACAEDDACLLTRATELANQLNNANVCLILSGRQESLCRAGVALDDPDRDGLDSMVEKTLYGTDPMNPDTDGDGYSDGQEVNGGYDPLK